MTKSNLPIRFLQFLTIWLLLPGCGFQEVGSSLAVVQSELAVIKSKCQSESGSKLVKRISMNFGNKWNIRSISSNLCDKSSVRGPSKSFQLQDATTAPQQEKEKFDFTEIKRQLLLEAKERQRIAAIEMTKLEADSGPKLTPINSIDPSKPAIFLNGQGTTDSLIKRELNLLDITLTNRGYQVIRTDNLSGEKLKTYLAEAKLKKPEVFNKDIRVISHGHGINIDGRHKTTGEDYYDQEEENFNPDLGNLDTIDEIVKPYADSTKGNMICYFGQCYSGTAIDQLNDENSIPGKSGPEGSISAISASQSDVPSNSGGATKDGESYGRMELVMADMLAMSNSNNDKYNYADTDGNGVVDFGETENYVQKVNGIYNGRPGQMVKIESLDLSDENSGKRYSVESGQFPTVGGNKDANNAVMFFKSDAAGENIPETRVSGEVVDEFKNTNPRYDASKDEVEAVRYGEGQNQEFYNQDGDDSGSTLN